MNSRALASIALGAVVLLGTTGCSMISPQATTISYAAAEGENVPDASGPVQIRNVFFVTDETGTTANLIGAFVNETAEAQTAIVQLLPGGEPMAVAVPAGQVVSLGVDGDNLRIDDFPAPAGSTVLVSFQSGSTGAATTVEIPVLDGALHYLESSAPEAE